MRTIVQIALAGVAAAGLAGFAHAVKPVGAAMDTVTDKSGHTAIPMAPDVTKIPLPPSPAGPGGVPIPYPNMGLKGKDGKKAQKVEDEPAQTKNTSTFKKSTGDEAGTLKGVVSGKNMDKVIFKKGSSKVKVEGKKTEILLTPMGHNGSNANMPAGAQIAPSQTKVMIGNAAVPDAAKPRDPAEPGVQPIPSGAPPAPAVLQRPAPLTPIAKPAVRPTPLPVRIEPVKAPTPILVQPVQPKPMTLQPTLQPQPVMRR